MDVALSYQMVPKQGGEVGWSPKSVLWGEERATDAPTLKVFSRPAKNVKSFL